MITIRGLHTIQEMQPIEVLERDIWGIDDLEIVPAHVSHAIAHCGGLVLGAFAENEMVGFAICQLGSLAGATPLADRLQLYSMVAGVLPAYQNQNVGYRLKLAQRTFAQQIGVPVITWTVDPLESRNGRFNFRKLGAVCQTYLPDYYGQMGGINAGLPSDRFRVAWHVNSNRVRQRVDQNALPTDHAILAQTAVLNPARWVGDRLVPTENPGWPENRSPCLVEIPADIRHIKQQEMTLALAWRWQTRELLTRLFAAGYTAVDQVLHRENDRLRSFILLEHE